MLENNAMTERSARWALPFILPGQAQKEVHHNESLALADALLHPAVEGAPLATPPVAPEPGQSWIVASGATGAWAGQALRLAVWTAGGWRFVAPGVGMAVWDKAAGLRRQWTGTAWSDGRIEAAAVYVSGAKVIGARQPAVANPSGGTTVDAEARATIAALIVALRTHGLID